ncbi:unnamed protein product [Protopolystoma xenopodis]|uniref:Uncharacterized protein n=1 Tax=Protopolystoma xenopodis TaxID=117903 RepID=A0A3S5BP06_9PLAT|nr:unnamed protein product [Protopolystoma xenopodis]
MPRLDLFYPLPVPILHSHSFTIDHCHRQNYAQPREYSAPEPYLKYWTFRLRQEGLSVSPFRRSIETQTGKIVFIMSSRHFDTQFCIINSDAIRVSHPVASYDEHKSCTLETLWPWRNNLTRLYPRVSSNSLYYPRLC